MIARGPHDQEVFHIARPSGAAGALVFASPHSGATFPSDLDPAPGLSTASLRSAEDAMVDRLIASATDYGVPILSGRISRSYVDLNRSPAELDPALIDGTSGVDVSAKTAAGFGVIPRRAGDGQALYDRRIGLVEATGRLDRIHRPYHAALEALMAEARERHGLAILIDWHSMPSRAAGAATGFRRSAPPLDIVVGDRHGAACGAWLSRRVRAVFQQTGWRVGLNQPYAGGYSTQLWGRPAEHVHALQIEINRSLYLDEQTLEPSSGFERCKAVIDRAIASLCAEDWPAVAGR